MSSQATGAVDAPASAFDYRGRILEALALAEDAHAVATLARAYLWEQQGRASVGMLQRTARLFGRLTRDLGATLCAALEADERLLMATRTRRPPRPRPR